uniref:Uncharacterized protein n=1 Tax=Tetranychus urticae TaxID=32264 RepID=T1L5D5_TETUR
MSDIFSKTDGKKAPGHDEDVLLHVYNLALREQIFPRIWKKAIVKGVSATKNRPYLILKII